jgi:glutamate/tyrosine decarboxylase-like PLP-dependent enzyme
MAGKTPLAVVASAGTVSTGAVDPLEEIADIAREHDLYLHVDGAYGGLAALAAPERIGPLGLADSVSFDLHKWLYQPVDCGLLLFRDRELARRTFTYTDDYVVSFADDPLEAFMFFEQTIELSRRFRALKVWLSVRYHGLRAYRTSIREDLELAQQLAQKIEAADELELLAPVVSELHGAARPSWLESRTDALTASIWQDQRAQRVYICRDSTASSRFLHREPYDGRGLDALIDGQRTALL